MRNALSIDVEDWFCVHNMSGVIKFEEWGRLESRVERNVMALLEILSQTKTKATFFVLGWVAERKEDMVRAIRQEGHEVATHGYSHRLLTSLRPREFEDDLVKSLTVLRNCIPDPVIGFRAPSFTITKQTLWALEILAKHGIKYDSSVFPVGFHPDYGIRDSPRQPYKIRDDLWEFPLSTLEIGSRRVPISGGAYFRIFPYAFTRFAIRGVNQEGLPVVFYLHPWEIDPCQPRLRLPWVKKFRHYCNLDKTEARLRMLLSEFQFTTIRDLLTL